MTSRASLFLLVWSAKLGCGIALSLVCAANESPVSVIELKQGPLASAVENLARHAGGNFILDPRVPEIPVTVRWEQITARAALQRLAGEHGLFFITNAATGVTRIAVTNRVARWVDAQWIAADTNAPIPFLRWDDAPLPMVLEELGRRAGLRVKVEEPKFRVNPQTGEFTMPPPTVSVSVRWEHLKPRQALAALCENYDLNLTIEAGTGLVRITFPDSQPARRGRRPDRP